MTQLRLALALLLFLLCFAAGREQARRLNQRSRTLGDFLKFSRHLEVLIRVNSWPIPDGLEHCGNRFAGQWMGALASHLAADYRGSAHSSRLWINRLVSMKKETFELSVLTEEDIQSIALFGDQLASSDIKSINESFQLLYHRLEHAIRESEKDGQVKGKLYRTIGALAGLAAAITIA